jgi:hypothetical protein
MEGQLKEHCIDHSPKLDEDQIYNDDRGERKTYKSINQDQNPSLSVFRAFHVTINCDPPSLILSRISAAIQS